LLGSALLVPIVAWAGFVIGHITGFVSRFLPSGGGASGGPLEWLFTWWAELAPWVTVAGAAVFVLCRAVRLRRHPDDDDAREDVRFFGPWVVGCAILCGVTYVLNHYVLPAATPFLSVLVGTAGGLLLVVTAGQLIIDQMRSAWLAGNDLLGVALGAMGIGTSFSTLLLASNMFGVYRIYPAELARWARQYALDANGPQLDTCLTLVVVLLSVVGIIRNLPELGSPPSWEEFRKSMVFQLVAVSMASVVPGVNAQLKGRPGTRV
jgi:hypothetical protein